MGKRYYCDYCDRSFVDDIQARKKHLNGTSHMRNRKLHYLQRRDLKTLIEEESAKEECYKFKNSGYCAHGENCFRSHFSRQQLQMFRDKLAIDEKRKFAASIGELRTVDSWLQKRNIVIPQYEIPQSSQTTLSTQFLLNSELPRQFPPSVQAIHLSDYMDTELFEWG